MNLESHTVSGHFGPLAKPGSVQLSQGVPAVDKRKLSTSEHRPAAKCCVITQYQAGIAFGVHAFGVSAYAVLATVSVAIHIKYNNRDTK